MRNKYGIISHADGLDKTRSGGSSLWKKIKTIIPYILDNSQWSIGCGESLFWLDNWCGLTLRPLATSFDNLKLTVSDGLKNQTLLNRVKCLVPLDIWS